MNLTTHDLPGCFSWLQFASALASMSTATVLAWASGVAQAAARASAKAQEAAQEAEQVAREAAALVEKLKALAVADDNMAPVQSTTTWLQPGWQRLPPPPPTTAAGSAATPGPTPPGPPPGPRPSPRGTAVADAEATAPMCTKDGVHKDVGFTTRDSAAYGDEIQTLEEVHSWISHLRCTLFRDDHQGHQAQLINMIEAHLQSNWHHFVITKCTTKANRCFNIRCKTCQQFVYATYTKHETPEPAKASLERFFFGVGITD